MCAGACKQRGIVRDVVRRQHSSKRRVRHSKQFPDKPFTPYIGQNIVQRRNCVFYFWRHNFYNMGLDMRRL